jgi:uncharacterized cupredoxin-like copper-binding protein
MYRSLKIVFAFALALLLVPHVPASAAPAGDQIEVSLSNFSFTPNMLRLQRNTSYTLHLMNNASGGHSFSAPELFAAVMIAPEDSSKIANGRIEIPAGQAVDVHLTPMTAGTYQIVCTHFLHQTFGMRGSAVIE